MDMKGDKFGYLRKSGAIGVSHKAIAVSGSTRGKGALGSSSEEKKGLAKRANIEGNESAMYEKLEKRSLKGLKGGGSEKELRQGHNSRGRMKGPVDAVKNPIRAQRQANRANIAAAKESRKMGNVGAVANARAQNRRGLQAATKFHGTEGSRELRQAPQTAARADLAAARGGVKAARQGLRDAMQAKRKTRRGLAGLV